VRSVVTAGLLDKGFASSGWASWSKVAALSRVGGGPPDMHGEICGRHGRKRAVTWEQEVDAGSAPCVPTPSSSSGNSAFETLVGGASKSCSDAPAEKTASPNSPVAFDPIAVFTGPAPGSATAIQPPATLATLAASPAAAAAKGAGSPAAFAPTGNSESDPLPGAKLKANGKPVRLHGIAQDKTGPARRSKRGAQVVAKSPAGEVAPATPAKGKHVGAKRKAKSASKPKPKAKAEPG
jgi:D-alanyl-D-alanine carboxypeptidase